MGLFRGEPKLPSAAEALSGRCERMTVASAHFINGNGPKAISTARRCLKLADSEKYRADLEMFTQGF